MEENKNWEQPNENSATAEQSAQEDSRAEKIQEGSLGKFKDTQSLLDAYNNLQAEFTRKCQMVSKLQKEETDNAQKQSAPVYMEEDWNEKVYRFLEENQQAKPYAKEISQMILADQNLAKNQDALSVAWSKIALQNFKTPEMALEDDDFVNNVVLKSDKVKQAFVKSLTQQISTNSPPNVINSASGGSYGFVKERVPNDLSEAKEMAKRFFD